MRIFMRRAQEAASRIRAAYDAGCRRFDSAIGGLGGCPFAQDVMVGNIPTEILISVLKECGADVPHLHPLDDLISASSKISLRFGSLCSRSIATSSSDCAVVSGGKIATLSNNCG